jgi:hypothetical protein
MVNDPPGFTLMVIDLIGMRKSPFLSLSVSKLGCEKRYHLFITPNRFASDGEKLHKERVIVKIS